MKTINLTNEEIEIIITWLNTYEPFPGDSNKKIEKEYKIIKDIKEKLR